MTVEKQSISQATITVTLKRGIGHDKDRSPYWTVTVVGNGSGSDLTMSVQNFDLEDEANKSYNRLKLIWGAQ